MDKDGIERVRRAILASPDADHGQPWGEGRVAAFEAAHGVALPDPYRAMLASVAATPFGAWAPGDGEGEWETLADVAKPFPLEEGWLTEEETDEAVLADRLPRLLHGTLPLLDLGCGRVDLLVVTGAARGQVWTRTDVGAFPWHLCGAEEWEAHGPSFEAWLATLDGRLDGM